MTVRTGLLGRNIHLHEQDPTIPIVDDFQESTMNRILEQIEVCSDHLNIKFIGENAVQVNL